MFRILRATPITCRRRRQALAKSYAASGRNRSFGTLSEMFGEVDEEVTQTPVVYVHGVARTSYIRGWAWQKVLHMTRRAERRKDNDYSIVVDDDDVDSYKRPENEDTNNDDDADDRIVDNDDEDEDQLDGRGADKKYKPVKDTVLMFEHDHIYTLGRGAKHKLNLPFLNFKFDPDGEKIDLSPEEYDFINTSRKRLHPKRQADDRASLYVNSQQLVSSKNGEVLVVKPFCSCHLIA
jgi:hypothetical protein